MVGAREFRVDFLEEGVWSQVQEVPRAPSQGSGVEIQGEERRIWWGVG